MQKSRYIGNGFDGCFVPGPLDYPFWESCLILSGDPRITGCGWAPRQDGHLVAISWGI